MPQSKVIITAKVHPYIEARFKELGFEVDVIEHIEVENLHSIIHAYSIIVITTYTKIDKSLIDAAAKLKIVARVGSGMENVDTDYCSSKQILCINSPEGNANAVGEHALALLLDLYNNITKSNNELRQNLFLREANRGEEIDGKKVGIIGFGHTGSAFAKKLRGFDVNILAYDKYKTIENDFVKNVTLEEIKTQCDVISFHVPYTQETHHLCDEKFIAACKKPVIINISRGAILKTNDLLNALELHQIKGLCLDVFEDEPITQNKIHTNEQYQKLLSYSNVIATPHIAGWTIESYYKLAKILMDKIETELKNVHL